MIPNAIPNTTLSKADMEKFDLEAMAYKVNRYKLAKAIIISHIRQCDLNVAIEEVKAAKSWGGR